MNDYLKQYREMISLRGLTDHTLTSYSTYISVYLRYLSDILGRSKTFPGLNSGILSAGSRRKGIFLTIPLMPVFPSCAFLTFMSCVSHGILTSSHSGSSTLICPLSPPGRKCRPSFLLLQIPNLKPCSA